MHLETRTFSRECSKIMNIGYSFFKLYKITDTTFETYGSGGGGSSSSITNALERLTYRATYVWQLGGIHLADVPSHHLGDRIKRVLALTRRQCNV